MLRAILLVLAIQTPALGLAPQDTLTQLGRIDAQLGRVEAQVDRLAAKANRVKPTILPVPPPQDTVKTPGGPAVVVVAVVNGQIVIKQSTGGVSIVAMPDGSVILAVDTTGGTLPGPIPVPIPVPPTVPPTPDIPPGPDQTLPIPVKPTPISGTLDVSVITDPNKPDQQALRRNVQIVALDDGQNIRVHQYRSDDPALGPVTPADPNNLNLQQYFQKPAGDIRKYAEPPTVILQSSSGYALDVFTVPKDGNGEWDINYVVAKIRKYKP